MNKFNKTDWLKRLKSEDIVIRTDALELSPKEAALVQEELFYWFACNVDFGARFRIFSLLNDQYQAMALDLVEDKGDLTVFDRTESFDVFESAEDLEMQRSIIYLERWFMKPTETFKNALYLEYKNQKGCDMEKAKLAVNRLFLEEPGHAGDDAMGGGRAPDL